MNIELNLPESGLGTHVIDQYQGFISQSGESGSQITHFFLIGENKVLTLLTSGNILSTFVLADEITTIESFLNENPQYGGLLKALKEQDFTMVINTSYDWFSELIATLQGTIDAIIKNRNPYNETTTSGKSLSEDDITEIEAKINSFKTNINNIDAKKEEVLSKIPSKDQSRGLELLQKIEISLSSFKAYWDNITSWPEKVVLDEDGQSTLELDLDEFMEYIALIETSFEGFEGMLQEYDDSFALYEEIDEESVDESDEQTIVM